VLLLFAVTILYQKIDGLSSVFIKFLIKILNIFSEVFSVDDSGLFKRVEALCNENNISVSALLTEITGSVGNAPTWKKGNIRSADLIAVCMKFDVSADFLLGLEMGNNQKFDCSERALSFAKRFDFLDEDGKVVVGNALIQEERRFENKKEQNSGAFAG